MQAARQPTSMNQFFCCYSSSNSEEGNALDFFFIMSLYDGLLSYMRRVLVTYKGTISSSYYRELKEENFMVNLWIPLKPTIRIPRKVFLWTVAHMLSRVSNGTVTALPQRKRKKLSGLIHTKRWEQEATQEQRLHHLTYSLTFPLSF